MEGLKASIERDGFLAPIVVRRCGSKYEILSGNHRVMAARELQHKTLPCVLIDPCDDDQASRIAINMNTVHGDPNAELIAPFISTMSDTVLKDLFLPADLFKDLLGFDQTMKERLDSFELPDALNNSSHGETIPNCVCDKCGKRHVAQISK